MKSKFDFPTLNSVVVTAAQTEIEALQADPNVLSVDDDPESFLPCYSEPRDRHRHLQEANCQYLPYGIEMVQANLAWEAGLAGAGVKVCVIDAGFDLTHEDFNSATYTGDSLVPGENWNEDSYGHGTHMTGIIAAANNDIGVVGVAPDVTIHMVDIYDELGKPYSSSLVEAAYKCRAAGAKIISMSLVGPSYLRQEQDAFAALYTQDRILLTAAAGNDGDSLKSYPGGYDKRLVRWCDRPNGEVDLLF